MPKLLQRNETSEGSPPHCYLPSPPQPYGLSHPAHPNNFSCRTAGEGLGWDLEQTQGSGKRFPEEWRLLIGRGWKAKAEPSEKERVCFISEEVKLVKNLSLNSDGWDLH